MDTFSGMTGRALYDAKQAAKKAAKPPVKKVDKKSTNANHKIDDMVDVFSNAVESLNISNLDYDVECKITNNPQFINVAKSYNRIIDESNMITKKDFGEHKNQDLSHCSNVICRITIKNKMVNYCKEHMPESTSFLIPLCSHKILYLPGYDNTIELTALENTLATSLMVYRKYLKSMVIYHGNQDDINKFQHWVNGIKDIAIMSKLGNVFLVED